MSKLAFASNTLLTKSNVLKKFLELRNYNSTPLLVFYFVFFKRATAQPQWSQQETWEFIEIRADRAGEGLHCIEEEQDALGGGEFWNDGERVLEERRGGIVCNEAYVFLHYSTIHLDTYFFINKSSGIFSFLTVRDMLGILYWKRMIDLVVY